MQLSLAFPTAQSPVNNRVMAGNDRSDAHKLEAAKKLRNKALRLLTTREHSREELLRKLAQAKARRARQDAQAPAPEKDDIERVIDDLAAQGWQSDERYAEAMVRRLNGQASRRYIEDRLATAGIKKDAAQQALEALDPDEIGVATALWQRRFGEAPADDKARQKQIRFLLSRGFHLGDAFKIVPRALTTPAPRRAAADLRATTRPSGGSWASRRTLPASGDEMRSAPADAARGADSTDSAAPLEYTRTSEQAGERRGPGLQPGGRRSSFRNAVVKRARPWGARNDADPSDE